MVDVVKGYKESEAEAFVAKRDRHRLAHDFPTRCTGISSDALAAYGLGHGPRPTVVGRPDHPGGLSWSGGECDRSSPMDEADLLACTVTFLLAPAWARARMLPVLTEFQNYVWYGKNRYGEKVCKGSRDAE